MAKNINSISGWPYGMVLKRWAAKFSWLGQRLEMDQATILLLSTRALQILVYPVTMILIARCLTAEMQGFYFTFSSLLALQIFVELGFIIAITNVASHEWAHLSLDSVGRITGHPEALSRIVSLGRLIFKWYAAASFIFAVVAVQVGWSFFSQKTYQGLGWQGPWILLVALSGLLLLMLPFNALLEGCNQVAVINKFRLMQVFLENGALWAFFWLGGGLWAPVAAVAARVGQNLFLLLIRYRRFFQPFFQSPSGSRIHWGREIWPLQWRLAAQSLVAYLAYHLFNPVMFYYHGAVVAGQMGMTLQAVQGLQLVAMAWVSTKVPRFGMFIAHKEYPALDRLWLRTSVISIAAISLGALALWFLLFRTSIVPPVLTQRFLGAGPTAIFLFAAIFFQISQCLVVYLRAHKQEPILVPGITLSVAAGLLVWGLGSRYGPLGAAAGNLAQIIVGSLWFAAIWQRCRTAWHKPCEVISP
ncbi:MAG: hypothetical protein C4567_16025 [Deltaproteobacteria bacterium]|nr:MAG: hypothetical protein C4567_16025 [Deltaproteobacteria bacterium]